MDGSISFQSFCLESCRLSQHPSPFETLKPLHFNIYLYRLCLYLYLVYATYWRNCIYYILHYISYTLYILYISYICHFREFLSWKKLWSELTTLASSQPQEEPAHLEPTWRDKLWKETNAHFVKTYHMERQARWITRNLKMWLKFSPRDDFSALSLLVPLLFCLGGWWRGQACHFSWTSNTNGEHKVFFLRSNGHLQIYHISRFQGILPGCVCVKIEAIQVCPNNTFLPIFRGWILCACSS